MYYLNYNSTSPILPSVTKKVQSYIAEEFGNPSSSDPFGKKAKEAIEQARHNLSELLAVQSREVIFTSGGTEAIYTALIGVYRAKPNKKHLVISSVEHPALFKCVEFLEELMGVETTIVPVDSNGLIDLEKLLSAIKDETALVSVIYANNETGVISPIVEIAEICKRRGVLLHVDAVQAIGKIPVNFNSEKIDLLSLSGHKLGALKGSGALIIRSGVKWLPFLEGGGQECGKRGGTEGVAGIVAIGEAAKIKSEFIFGEGVEEMVKLRKRFENELLNKISGSYLNVEHNLRLPNTISAGFDRVNGAALTEKLKENQIYISAGAACKSSSASPSHVLTAYGISPQKALQGIRISFGSDLKEEDLNPVIAKIKECVEILRN